MSSNQVAAVWELGPFHSALPGPIGLKLKLDGEVIAACGIETGFLHKGLEKALELHPWKSSISYVDHLEPESAVYGELALCLAVEEMNEIIVPERAQYIRTIVAELTRISSHLMYMVRVAKVTGSETIIHYLLRDRERILDLFELVAGARFSINFLRFGGVSADVTDGFIERVSEVCELTRVRMKEYNDLFTYNHGFMKRSSMLGVLPIELIHKLGITGPNARASGLSFDIRRAIPYMRYENLDFEVPQGRSEGAELGDVHDRFIIRLREITQSIEILKQLIENVPTGEFLNSSIREDFIPQPGEAYSRVESPRGLLGCHVVSDGSAMPVRIQFRPPTLASLMAIRHLAVGIRVEDLPLLLASLDLSIAEADR